MDRSTLRTPSKGRGLIQIFDSKLEGHSMKIPSDEGIHSMDLDDTPRTTLLPSDIQRLIERNTSYSSLEKTRFLMDSQHDISLTRLGDINEIISLSKEKTNMLYPQFLEVLQTHTNDTEIFDTIQDYIEICSGILQESTKEENMTVSKYKSKDSLWLEQEKNTWKLLYCLYKDRIIVQKEEVDYDMPTLSGSEKEVVNALYTSIIYFYEIFNFHFILIRLFIFTANSTVREYQLIIDWLEACAQDQVIQVPHFTDRTVGWENTLFQLQCPDSVKFGGTQDIVKSLDPDAPCRERKPLHPLDMEDQDRLIKHIFQTIRQGRIEDAKALCEYCGQPWRAAILEGWRLYEDPNYELSNEREKEPIEGNPRRDIWKKFAWMMADSNKFDDYTRAITGVFCGHLESLLAVSGDSWEDLLWAYLKVQIDIRVENEIRSCCTKTYIPMPEKYGNNAMNLQQIFDEIFQKNIMIQEAAKNPINIIQKHLIMDNISELLCEMQKWIEEKNLSSHMLRFLSHIVLFMRQIGRIDREEIADQIIKAYVESLIEIGDAQLIAFYTSELPGDLQIIMYSKYVQTIKETEKRKVALEEALNAGLDIQSITSHAVNTIRNLQNDNADDNIKLKGEISEFDNEKISALELLTFYPEQKGELLWQANAMIRIFLADSKIENVRKILKIIPTDTISQIISIYGGKDNLPYQEECSIKEYLCHQTYLAAIEGFNDWSTLYYNRPKEPEITSKINSNFTERIASEHKQQAYKAELERWKNHLEEQTRS